jgi:hypothetical protein
MIRNDEPLTDTEHRLHALHNKYIFSTTVQISSFLSSIIVVIINAMCVSVNNQTQITNWLHTTSLLIMMNQIIYLYRLQNHILSGEMDDNDGFVLMKYIINFCNISYGIYGMTKIEYIIIIPINNYILILFFCNIIKLLWQYVINFYYYYKATDPSIIIYPYYHIDGYDNNRRDRYVTLSSNSSSDELIEVIVGQSNCSICLSGLKTPDKNRLLDCDHTFHKKCINKWLTLRNTCPICRLDCQ